MREDAKVKAARKFRKALTQAELWLWLRLKVRVVGKPVFRNQHPVGPYVLDFYCAEAMLCVEVDGAVHTYDEKIARDLVRDQWLSDKGIYTHRVVGAHVLADPDSTAEAIIELAIQRMRGLQDSPISSPEDGTGNT